MEKCDGNGCPWTETCKKFKKDDDEAQPAPYKNGMCKEYEPKKEKDLIEERKNNLKEKKPLKKEESSDNVK